jgi:hypothetical protein
MAAISFFTDPVFLAFLRFWLDRRGSGDDIATWRDELPSELPPSVAPFVVFTRYDVAAGDGVYVHAGSRLVELFGADPAGKTVSELIRPPIRDYLHDLVVAMVQARSPIFSSCVYYAADRPPLRTGRLFVPFSDDVLGTAQMAQHGTAPATRYCRDAGFEELERRRIVASSDELARLERAARYHRLAAGSLAQQFATDLARAAEDFERGASEPLPVLVLA